MLQMFWRDCGIMGYVVVRVGPCRALLAPNPKGPKICNFAGQDVATLVVIRENHYNNDRRLTFNKFTDRHLPIKCSVHGFEFFNTFIAPGKIVKRKIKDGRSTVLAFWALYWLFWLQSGVVCGVF